MSSRAPLLAGLTAVLLAVLTWFFLIQPQREERAALIVEAETIRAQQQQQLLEIARLEEIQANELEVRAAIVRLEEYIPSGPSQPSTIRQLQLAADAAGVGITALTFAEPQPVPDAPPPAEAGAVLAEIPVTMTVEGGYFQATDFLRRMEGDLPRAITVDALTITEAPAPREFPTLSVTVNARVFTVIPAAALPGAVPPPPPTGGAEAPDGAAVEGGADVEDGAEVQISRTASRRQEAA